MNLFEPHIRKKKHAIQIIEKLEKDGFEARLAGGCVRDEVMGLTPNDYDIATTALPEKVEQLFSSPPYKSVPTGKEHGTITVVYKGSGFEITTLREDVNTDGRRAEVEFGSSFEKDSLRRDFTINALYEDKNGKIYDYHGGVDHIKEKVLTFVGEAEFRIKEDYLRILRYYRFSTRLGFYGSDNDLKAIKSLSNEIISLSKERVLSELTKIFTVISDEKNFRELIEFKILEHSFKKADLNDFQKSLELYKGLPKRFFNIPFAHIFKMFMFLDENKVSGDDILSILQGLNASKKELNLIQLITNTLSNKDLDNQANKLECLNRYENIFEKATFTQIGIDLFSILGDLTSIDKRFAVFKELSNLEQTKSNLRSSTPILNGNDIASFLEIKPGKMLGDLSKLLRKAQLNEEITTKDEAKKWLFKAYNKLLNNKKI